MMEMIVVEVEDVLMTSNGNGGGVELPEIPLNPTIE